MKNLKEQIKTLVESEDIANIILAYELSSGLGLLNHFAHECIPFLNKIPLKFRKQYIYPNIRFSKRAVLLIAKHQDKKLLYKFIEFKKGYFNKDIQEFGIKYTEKAAENEEDFFSQKIARNEIRLHYFSVLRGGRWKYPIARGLTISW